MNYSSEIIGKLIRLERVKRNWSQTQLGKKIGVSGKQISNYENGTPAPPIETLFLLCKILNCELGYLLGEADYSEGSKIETAIHDITGLSAMTIEAIKGITGATRHCPEMGYEVEKYRRILNNLLASPHFRYVVECLADLDKCISKSNEESEKLKKSLGFELYEEAMQLYCSSTDYEHDPSIAIRPELCEAMKQIVSVINYQETFSYPMKVARYELREAFEELIEDLYPKQRNKQFHPA